MEKEIIHFQELAHNAWTAKDNVLFKGWILRFSEGVTRRANSVLTLRYLGNDVESDVKNVEELYTSRSLPTIFQVADYFEPNKLVEVLESQRYEKQGETIVMSKSIKNHHEKKHNTPLQYTTELEVQDDWFHTFAKLSLSSSDKVLGIKKIVGRITLGKIICYAKEGTDTLGTVLGIINNDSIGIYNLIVHQKRRREGIGENIMLKVMNWSKKNNIHTMYLAVEKENKGAIALYTKLGFKEKFGYRYFVKQPD